MPGSRQTRSSHCPGARYATCKFVIGEMLINLGHHQKAAPVFAPAEGGKRDQRVVSATSRKEQ
jgi:hypothetical protein